jgi:hypothetical protein
MVKWVGDRKSYSVMECRYSEMLGDRKSYSVMECRYGEMVGRQKELQKEKFWLQSTEIIQ